MPELSYCCPENKTESMSIEALALLKARLLADGVRLSPTISETDFQRPFYSVVTQGLELDLLNGITANARINTDSDIVLRQTEGRLELAISGTRHQAKILPISEALSKQIPGTSQPVSDYCYIATDRINIWAVESCAMAVQNTPCRFCDVAFEDVPYRLQATENIQRATEALICDKSLPARHIQVSGGTPLKDDWEHFLSVCEIAVETGLPVSVMTTPWSPIEVLETLRHIGVTELALNMEFSSDAIRRDLTPGKMEGGWDRLGKVAERWPRGTVRSALIVGPETEDSTLEGVCNLLERGVVPMLSPFRPAPGTPMAEGKAPSAEMLYNVFMRALEYASKHSSSIGPSCRHCQHNVMSLPFDLL